MITVIDTSAVMAILLDEPEAAACQLAIVGADDARISAMNDLEARIVSLNRRGPELVRSYEQLLEDGRISIVAFGPRDASSAFDAFVRWGKGRDPAGLNYGDCAAYALARSLDAPLLFKGTDFARTDVRRAL